MRAGTSRRWALGVGLALLGASAAAERAATPPAGPARRAKSARAADPGRPGQPPVHRERVLRRWQDTFKTPEGEVARRAEIVFDYTAGLAREDSYDLAGNRISSRPLPDSQPAPSEEELVEAMAVIEGDPYLARIVRRTGARPHGHFVLEERDGLACGPRTRCIQVLLVTPEGTGLVRRVVVDLTKSAIVYRSYVPSEDTGPSSESTTRRSQETIR